MAEENAIKLDPETRKRLANMDADIEGAEKAMETMKKLGMDVSAIEDKVAWAREVKDTLLSEFG